MLLDMLGILIGFVIVILLLSILVTSAVQMFTSLVRLRHRSLVKGLNRGQLLEVADRIALKLRGDLEAANSATAQSLVAESVSSMKQIISTAKADKRVTWIDVKELVEPLRAAGAHPATIAVVEQQFGRAKQFMEDIFLHWVRIITAIIAFAIAFTFQVSTPHLLERLQEDEEFRIRAEAAGERIAASPGAEFEFILTDAGIAARQAFLEAHPQYTEQLGELTFHSTSVNDLVADFETAMDAVEERDILAAEYRRLIEEGIGDFESAKRAAMKSISELDALDIRFMADKALYRNRHYLVGFLITAVLLSFGAPFWFNVLKELVGLKDALRKKNEKEEEQAEAANK